MNLESKQGSGSPAEQRLQSELESLSTLQMMVPNEILDRMLEGCVSKMDPELKRNLLRVAKKLTELIESEK